MIHCLQQVPRRWSHICIHVLAVVNSAAINPGVHIVVVVVFSIMAFSGYLPSSGIAESYGSFIPSLD